MNSNNFASIKLSVPFVAWLKRQAAARGVPMYELVEELCARVYGKKPWREKSVSAASTHRVRYSR